MKIGTFGSCLSRRTAKQLRKLVGGELLTSVYHNRSDQFLRSYACGFPELADLMRLIDGVEHGHRPQEPIMTSQTLEGLGLSRGDGLQFFDALPQLDLLLVDSFMDLSAFLWRTDAGEFFSTANLEDRYTRGGFIDPIEAARNYRTICGIFATENPKMRIAFLPFPHHGYVGDARRAEWNTRFIAALSLDVPVLPLFAVPPSVRTEHPAHFKLPMYQMYANAVLHAVPLRLTWAGWIRRISAQLSFVEDIDFTRVEGVGAVNRG